MIMDKKKINIIIAIVACVVVIGCFFATSNITKEGTGVQTGSSDDITARAQQEAASVNDDERKEFTKAEDVDHYLNLYNATDKKRLVLLASPTCGYCQIAQPILENIAFEYDLKIYYLDSSAFDGEDQSKFISSNEIFAEGFGTPMLLLVSDGKIHDSVDGLVDRAGYVEFFKRNGFISE